MNNEQIFKNDAQVSKNLQSQQAFNFNSAGNLDQNQLGNPVASSGFTPVLAAVNVTKIYGNGDIATPALNQVSLQVGVTESVAIMGPSGSGKTTLLHVLAGVLTPTQGEVMYRGMLLNDVSDAKRTKLRRTDFGFVFQDAQLLPELTVLDNVSLPQMLNGVKRAQAAEAAQHWLNVLGLSGMEKRRPGQLSGGQMQRVAIARAMAHNPSVVFADEPTGALDQATGREVMNTLVSACQQTGATLLVVTHDPAVASFASRTIAMQDGRIAQEFRRSDYLTNEPNAAEEK